MELNTMPIQVTCYMDDIIVGDTMYRVHNFSSCNVPKVTTNSTRQVLISDCTVTSSKSSSLCSKCRCSSLQKCPPKQKIGVTCFLTVWWTVQRCVLSANFCVLSRTRKVIIYGYYFQKGFCLHKLPPSIEWMTHNILDVNSACINKYSMLT